MRRLLMLLVLGLALACVAAPPALAGSDDEAIAEDSVLTEADVADYGLFEESDDEDDSPPPSGAACRDIRRADRAANRAPSARSAFSDGGSVLVEDRVTILKSVKAARAVLEPYTDPSASDCVEQILEQSLQENLEPGSSYEFNGDATEIDVGDGGVVYQIVVEIEDPDGNLTEVYVELGAFRVGRGFATMSVFADGAPFEGSEDLATIIADNLERNLETS